MANRKLSQLTEKTTLPTSALIHILDPNDISESPSGTDFKINTSTFLTQTFRGAITLVSAAPTAIGSYIPTESGTYINFGSKVIDLTTGSAIIIYDGTTFSVQKTTIDLTAYVQKSSIAVFNVTIEVPLGSGFYTSTTARAAVPASIRKFGLIITYSTSSNTWVCERYSNTTTVGAWAVEAAWSVIDRNFAFQKKNVSILNRETTSIIFNSINKTIVFPSGIQIIDKSVGRLFTLTAQNTINLGANNYILIYFDSTDGLIKFNGVITIEESIALYDSFHANKNSYIIGTAFAVSSGQILPNLDINASYYSVDGNVFGDGRNYTTSQIEAIKLNFDPSILKSEWYIGDVTKLTNSNVKSVIPAIKDIWFEFLNGKPTWWDTCRFRFVTVFRPDYTASPADNDTLFQIRITSLDGTTFDEIFNFFRREFTNVSSLALHSKYQTIGGFQMRLNIYADISAYSSTQPIPRDDTSNFNVFAKLKSTSIYKDALEALPEAKKIYYAGNELFVTDLYPTNLFKRGLSTNKEIKTISLVAKTLPFLNDNVTTPYDPSALVTLRDTLRDNKMPTYKYSTDMLTLTHDEAGDKIVLGVDLPSIENKKYGIELNTRRKKISNVVATTVNVMTIGASSTDSGLASYTKLLLEDNGIIFNGIGTKPDYFSTRGEGRGGWSYSMYTGVSSLSAVNNDIVPIATVGATTTGYENPFLYIATAQQKIDHPNWCFRRSVAGSRAELSYQTDADKTGNFYIFDFVRYLSDRSVFSPEIITLQLGMNDYYSTYWGNSQATINSALSLEIIYTQIRLALPTTPIGVLTYMPRFTNTGGFNAVDGLAIKNYCNVVNQFFVDKSDVNFHAINTHALMNPDYIFDITKGELIDNSGNSTTQLALQTPFDGVHFSKNGYIEFSKILVNFILNMMT